jgi:hypothetical protein
MFHLVLEYFLNTLLLLAVVVHKTTSQVAVERVDS